MPSSSNVLHKCNTRCQREIGLLISTLAPSEVLALTQVTQVLTPILLRSCWLTSPCMISAVGEWNRCSKAIIRAWA